MEPGKIEYIAPTKRAFEGMKNILFRPFDIQKWFVLGFSAWLAALGEGGGSSGGGGFDGSDFEPSEDGSSPFEAATTWIQENLMLIVIIGLVVLAVFAVIGIAILWVQSRGKFMFFDNVIRNRTLISEPWKQFRQLANSLFLWRLVFGLVVTFFFLALGGWTFYLVWPMIEAQTFDSDVIPFFVIIGVILFLGIIALSYIMTLLDSFVIPIMHREGIPTNAAWRTFLPLHRQQVGSFILFYLWLLVVGVLTGLAVLLLIVGTCCIAAIPLIIPYLGTVLMLPLYVFVRLIGPEFLKQFGEPFDTMSLEVRPPLPLNLITSP